MNIVVHPYEVPVTDKVNTKRTTARSVRDYDAVAYRTKSLGTRVDLVTDTLKNTFGQNVTASWLLHWAKRIEQMLGLQIDRLARRNRQALFCWFTENWDIVHPFIVSHTNGDSEIHIDVRNFYDVRVLLNSY